MEKVSERRMMMKMMMIGEATTVVGDNRRAMRSAGPRILAYVFPTHARIKYDDKMLQKRNQNPREEEAR